MFAKEALLTQGGRVLGVTGMDATLVGAKDHAYQALSPIQFEGRYFRADIAHRVFLVQLVLEAVVEHRLDQLHVEWHDQSAVCVVLTSGGYPGSYQTGFPITGLPERESESVMVFHSGTMFAKEALLTQGGRVLGVTGRDATLVGAKEHAYQALSPIQFEGRYFRADIAHRVFHVSA